MATCEGLHDGLREWETLLQAKAHLLLRRPTLLFQEAANEPDTSLPARTAKERYTAGLERRPFLLRTDKPQRRSLCLMTLAGHTREVSACAFSPDGRSLVSWGSNGHTEAELLAWDARSGEKLGALRGHERGVWDCDFSPDGRRLASVDGADLRVWDTTTFAQVIRVPWKEGQLGLFVQYVPDGRRLVTQAGPHGLLIVDGETGLPTARIPVPATRERRGCPPGRNDVDVGRPLRVWLCAVPGLVRDRANGARLGGPLPAL